jgi:hypothetical protein
VAGANGPLLAKVDKRLAMLRRGRKLMSNDLAQFIQRSRRDVHNPLEFSAIPALVSSQTRRTDTPLSYLFPPFESQRRDQLLEIAKDFATEDTYAASTATLEGWASFGLARAENLGGLAPRS